MPWGRWAVLTLAGLMIGMAGYMATERLSVTDAYVNAAMILSGMGPVAEMRQQREVFAGSYAIFSGLVLVIGAGLILGAFHRVLHRFHVERGKED